MKKPTISIITPTYNAEKFISDTIESVKNQTFKEYEHIFIDDCSKDNTVNIIESYANSDDRIKLIKLTENSGAAVARNTGLSKASAKYIAFLDSDDIWEPEKLAKQLTFMQSNSYSFSYTAYQLVKENGEPYGKIIDKNAKDSVNYHDMLCKRSTLGCSTVMLDRESIDKIEMPLIRTGQDYGLWLDILKRGHTAHCLHETLTHYRIVANSISRNKVKKAMRQWQIYREIEQVSLPLSAWYFANYAYRVLVR